MIAMNLMEISVEEIPEAVRVWCEKNSSRTGFCFGSYLEYIDGEIVERTFATRHYKKGVKIHEVMRDCTGNSSSFIIRDLMYTRMGGYIPIFEAVDRYTHLSGYGFKVFDKKEFEKWYHPDFAVGIGVGYINPEIIFTIPEFKYCGYSCGGVISYLNAYRKDKSVEFFGKMGLYLSPVLIRKAKADGKFRRFLWENHNAIALYGVQAALYAYKTGCNVEEARRICYLKNKLDRCVFTRIPEICGTKLNRQRVKDYVDSNNINYESYNDYLKCCLSLKLDIYDTKVAFPNDFKRMHDLRASEYASFEAKKDRKKRAKLYRDFRTKAKEYKALESKNERYAIVCPTDISDLIREGAVLSHCVGKMGYDKKVVDGVSIIMFIREVDRPNVPFVTLEYRIDRKALSQCYGYKDSKPAPDVIAFAEEWANGVKELQKQAEKEQEMIKWQSMKRAVCTG